jgi:hypothetical protein
LRDRRDRHEELSSFELDEFGGDGLTIPGQAERFTTEYAPRPAEADEIVDYGKSGNPRPSIYERAPVRSSVPNWLRQDSVRRQQAIAAEQLAAQGASEMVSWNDLQAVARAYESGRPLVDFSRSPYDDGPPAPDPLGRSVRRSRHRARG